MRSSLYYSLVGLGFASFVTEVVFSKFFYDSGCNGLNSLGQGLFKSSMPVALQQSISGVAATLNLVACITLIAPVNNAKKLLYPENPISKSNTDGYGIKNLLRGIFKSIVLSAMLTYFTVISWANWLGIDDWIEPYPGLNYFAGVALIMTGIAYNILLSGEDVVQSTQQFQGFNWSMTRQLLIYSPSTYAIASSKFLVSAIYKASVAGFIGRSILGDTIKSSTYQSIGQGIGIVSCLIVLFLTRYPTTIKTYVQPYLDEDKQIDFTRLQNYMTDAKEQIKKSCQWHVIIRALIRGAGAGVLIFSLMQDYLPKTSGLMPVVGIVAAIIVGGLIFASLYQVDYQLSTAYRAATQADNALEDRQVNHSLSMRILADAINFGSLLATALLASHSIITLFSDFMSMNSAAILALAISLETVWVSFFYYRDKYYDCLQGHYQTSTVICHKLSNYMKISHLQKTEIMVEDAYEALNYND